MRFMYLFFVLIFMLFCSKSNNSTDSEENGNAKLVIVVKDINNELVKEGWVKIKVEVGVDPVFPNTPWTSISYEEQKHLDKNGQAKFIFEEHEIDPSKGYVTVKKIQIYDETLKIIKEDESHYKVYAGKTETIEITLD